MKKLLTLTCALLITISTGCVGTVTPRPITTSVVGFDGNDQNGGLVTPSVNGQPAVITAHARDRYNALIALQPKFAKNGHALLIPLKPDDGLVARPDGNWTIDAEHLADFGKLNLWWKNGYAK